jgi:hypothetical protein
MAVKQVFKSYVLNSSIHLPTGEKVVFNNGVTYVDNPEAVKYLQEQVDAKHPHIYRDPEQLEIDTELQERAVQAAALAIQQVLMEGKAGTDVSTSKLLEDALKAQVGAAPEAIPAGALNAISTVLPNPVASNSINALNAALARTGNKNK